MKSIFHTFVLQGSNFHRRQIVKRPTDGTETTLKPDVGSLNRIDRLTSANYSLQSIKIVAKIYSSLLTGNP